MHQGLQLGLLQPTEVTGDAIQTADEVVLMQGHSKTDPNGQVSVANAFEAPGCALCLVGLFKHAQRLNPGLFANTESFLLTQSNGKVLHRDVMVKNLSEAAVALGAPAGAASVISLAGPRSRPRRGREDARVVVLADGVASGLPAPRVREN